MYHYWFSLSAIFSLAKNCICTTRALSNFFAKALIRRQKSSIPSCLVIEPTDGEKKNLLLCDCQKSKVTTVGLVKKMLLDQTSAAGRWSETGPGVFVLRWIHSRLNIFTLERAKSCRERKNRRAAVERVTFFFFLISVVYLSSGVISFCIQPFADAAECP